MPQDASNLSKPAFQPTTCSRLVVLLTMFVIVAAAASAASTESVLYSFHQNDHPWAGVIFDPSGNLYGISTYGGAYAQGAVFKLSRTSSNIWKETLLHSFQGGVDGATPYAGLAMDAKGSLYGTTTSGGAYGKGTVFQLSLVTGRWSKKTLHSFKGTGDGAAPYDPVVVDAFGNVYGSSDHGNGCPVNNDFGLIFELKHTPTGWSEQVLHRFCQFSDGATPGPLTLGPDGDLYGTAGGGSTGFGSVFKLHQGSAGWQKIIVHGFSFPEGEPLGKLVFDTTGNMYGVGGGGTAGTVYQLMASSTAWTFKLLYKFTGMSDGGDPVGVTVDQKDTIYGATATNGAYGPYGGTVFKLLHNSNGSWTHTTLHSFGEPGDGEAPYGGVAVNGAGILYGTTQNGGTNCLCGVVFEIIP